MGNSMRLRGPTSRTGGYRKETHSEIGFKHCFHHRGKASWLFVASYSASGLFDQTLLGYFSASWLPCTPIGCHWILKWWSWFIIIPVNPRPRKKSHSTSSWMNIIVQEDFSTMFHQSLQLIHSLSSCINHVRCSVSPLKWTLESGG